LIEDMTVSVLKSNPDWHQVARLREPDFNASGALSVAILRAKPGQSPNAPREFQNLCGGHLKAQEPH
jgi:hypothetical protein